jgi:hypothetical protein
MGDRTFWTGAIPDDDVEVHLGAGRAEMRVHGLAVTDYFNKRNSFDDGGLLGEADATVSFDVVWSGPVTRRLNVSDAANGFAGEFVENQVTVTWSGSNERGFRFTSDPGDFSTSVPGDSFAELAHDHNGDFFPGGGSVATPRANSPANSAPDLAFAQMALQGGNAMVPPVLAPSGLALPNHLNTTGSDEGQPLLTGQLKNGSSGDSAAKAATTAPTIRERALGSVAGPAATSTTSFAEIGQPGEDPLFR